MPLDGEDAQPCNELAEEPGSPGASVRVVSGLLSIEEAQHRILERVHPLAAEPVPLEEAAGRTLADPVRALVDLPPFPSSAMDGFALRAADTPGELPVSESIAAGRPAPRALRPGEAMSIATGGVVPAGADAVVQLELVVHQDNKITVLSAVTPGANVRPRGGDVRAGDVVAERGVRLGPVQIGAIAAAGNANVQCAERPRVAVLATGTELRAPGEALEPGEVYDANGVMLVALLRQAGALPEPLASVADDEAAHRSMLEDGLRRDVLVTSGGVSVGPHDLVRGVGKELGVEEVFWGVSLKPGKPLWFGVRGRTLVFGLPGNPVSSLVCFELFVRPAVLALQGSLDALPRFESGVAARAIRPNRERDELVRGRAAYRDGEVVLEPLDGQDSHMIARAASADSLILVARGESEVPPGAPVRYLPLAPR